MEQVPALPSSEGRTFLGTPQSMLIVTTLYFIRENRKSDEIAADESACYKQKINGLTSLT